MKPKLPTARKTLWILWALKGGFKLTVARALGEYHVFALSQEVGRLKRLGWPIESKMIKSSEGAHIKQYWMPHG